jgi:hypothetical protein
MGMRNRWQWQAEETLKALREVKFARAYEVLRMSKIEVQLYLAHE